MVVDDAATCELCIQLKELHTLQGINISHLGKRKIIFKMPFLGDMLVSWRVYQLEKKLTQASSQKILMQVLVQRNEALLTACSKWIHLIPK